MYNYKILNNKFVKQIGGTQQRKTTKEQKFYKVQ